MSQKGERKSKNESKRMSLGRRLLGDERLGGSWNLYIARSEPGWQEFTVINVDSY